jgi:GTP pyrophosphokinase
VIAKLRGDGEPQPAPEPERPRRRSFFRREPAPASSGIRVDGQPDVLVRFGGCCSPIPGDEVVGFVTRGRGVTVHARDCAHAFTQDPDRRIEVEWETRTPVPRQIKVRVVSVDQPGVLARITKSIASTGVNIGGARVATSDDKTAIHDFDLWVADLRSLNTVMKEIGRVRGVLSVERVRA